MNSYFYLKKLFACREEEEEEEEAEEEEGEEECSLICNHEMCPWSMCCCIACLGCTDCSGMCACLPALCCWRWIVWCMHVSCIDSDVDSCFRLGSALSQSSWIRRYISVTYYYYSEEEGK